MTTKTAYLYDGATGEYLVTYEAQESPYEPGEFIAPALSTFVAPPVAGVNQVAVFSLGAWVLMPDFRKATVYDQASGNVVAVLTIGSLASGLALTPPPPNYAAIKLAACVAIDSAAATTRAKYCPYDLQDKEYEMAYADAIAWLANQAAPVPETIQVWVRVNAAKNWTALDAANDIKTTGDMMNSKLVQIRSARIDGKGAVNACANDATAIAAARDTAIAALQAL